MAGRSIDPEDYQSLPVSLAVMPKHFVNGHRIALHSHKRDQLVYAIAGLMRVETSEDRWIVPSDRALLVPRSVEHSIEICGDVEMRTLYMVPKDSMGIRVISVAPLLRELIISLAQEPMDYSDNLQARKIADLIMSELERASGLPLNIPLPHDARLQRLCQALLHDPSNGQSLEQFAGSVGASSKTLGRLFERELGMGFSAWRRRVRFVKAIELLGRGRSVKFVARGCGYESPSAFTYAFRSEFGVPPTLFDGH